MEIKTKATEFELTQETKNYVDKKIESLEKFITNLDEAICEIELALRKHHGEMYYAEINIMANGRMLRATAEEKTLYAAIDKAKDELKRELRKSKDKNETLFRRGGKSIKKLFRNLGK